MPQRRQSDQHSTRHEDRSHVSTLDLGLRRLLAAAEIDLARDDVRIGPVPGTGQPGVSFGVTAAKALEDGTIDGFWANAIGAETAVRRGSGTIILDVRRGDGPPAARDYTFAALVTTDRTMARAPKPSPLPCAPL